MILNYVFLGIFCVEAVLKLACMGKEYFSDDYNKFDFFIIMLTWTSTIIEYVF